MRLHSLHVEGFRRLADTTVNFGEATFLIGANNSGKSSIFRAIEYLLSAKKRIPEAEYYAEIDSETGEQKPVATQIILDAEFRNLPNEAADWRGFKGRILTYDPEGEDDTGNSIRYRKTYTLTSDCKVEILSHKRVLKEGFDKAKASYDLIDLGVPKESVVATFGDGSINLTAKNKSKLQEIDELWQLEDEISWEENPGGIPGVVLSRLPNFLLIPEETNAREIEHSSGVLATTLNELFADVRNDSENYKNAQEHLNALAAELDPTDGGSDFGQLMGDINTVLSGVFPDSAIHAKASLADPDAVLKPTFEIKLESNIQTEVKFQGAGMIRSAVFALLRYRQQWLSKRSTGTPRGLIIGFEEPEIYLHPSAANQMRTTIYELSGAGSQIVATTHSPFLIDLSKQPRQVLNRMVANDNGIRVEAFNVSDKYQELEDDDKHHLKMILKIDDHVSRVFFTSTVVIVEGDTEDVVLREALRRLAISHREAYLRIVRDFEVVKARGKASIISFVRYLRALSVDLVVIHDRDGGTPGAEKFNQPIAVAVGDAAKVIQLHECLEDELGIDTPSSEKPFNAYKHTMEWPENWDGVPERIREILGQAFDGYLNFES
ncbi:ATP-dependent nuclease [Thalassospira lucentensis]|uniref:ATP-dependent nuclease n=1 Tax=Thalassospira lucentensis TaxID=168935 RepID=UPI003AA8D5E3